MLPPNAVLVAVMFNIFGTASYVIATVRGRTKPNRVTWLLWAVAPLIAFSAEVGKGVGIRSLTTFMVGFGPLLVFGATFVNRSSYWRITTFDKVCGSISVLALVGWAVLREGNVAIALSILADFVAGVPTAAKAYRAPETEDNRVFLCAAASSAIGLLTVTEWSFATVAFPLYILTFAGGVGLVITFPNVRPGRRRGRLGGSDAVPPGSP